MYRSALRATCCGVVTSATIIAALGSSAQANTLTDTGANAYWGGLNQYNPSTGDVIGTSDFAISSAVVSRSLDGNTLTVKINTGFAGLPGTGPADGTTYGSLFFAPTWTPTTAAGANNNGPHYGADVYQPNDWTQAFVLNPPVNGANASGTGALYSTGTVNGSVTVPSGSNSVVKYYTTDTGGKVVMSNVGGDPISAPAPGNPGFYFRQGQAVEYAPGSGQPTLGAGTWTVSAALDVITFSIVDNGLLSNNFAMAWAMTCANDVIQGTVTTCPDGVACANNPPVPVPAAFILMGTVLFGAGGVAGWRKRRVRAAA